MIQRSKVQDGLEAITFVLDGGPNVSVVGDFNDWDPYANPLLPGAGGQRTTCIELAPGSYAFRYLSDGRFFDDPDADSYVDNGRGDVNGVLEVALPPDAPKKASEAPPTKKPHSAPSADIP
jgi:hypothetical protein